MALNTVSEENLDTQQQQFNLPESQHRGIQSDAVDNCAITEESSNYCRLSLLVLDIGRERLLRLFYFLVPKHTVKLYFVSKKKTIDDAQRKHILDKEQHSKLTCKDPNPDGYDILLLMKLLNCCKMVPTLQNDLEKLRKIRNDVICHTSSASLPKECFERFWLQVENILLCVAKVVSTDEEKQTRMTIQDLKHKLLDNSDREKKLTIVPEELHTERETAIPNDVHYPHGYVALVVENFKCLKEKEDKANAQVMVHKKGKYVQMTGMPALVNTSKKKPNFLLPLKECNSPGVFIEWDKVKKLFGPVNNTGKSITKEGSLKRYRRTSVGDKWNEVQAILYSDSTLQTGEIRIFLKEVWNFLGYGDHVSENFDDIPPLPLGACLSCLLAVPKKPSYKSESQYFLFYNEKELEGWMTAISRSIPQLLIQQDLINRKNFSHLQISPLIRELGHMSKLLDIHVSPSLEVIDHKAPKQQSDAKYIESFHDIFMKTSKETYRNIYISSPAGCGKTALSKRIALTWCHAQLPIKEDNIYFKKDDTDVMKTFTLLFFISLRDTHEHECDIEIMIQRCLLCYLTNAATFKKSDLDFIQNILNNERCLIVLDGLDEWCHPRNNRCTAQNKRIPHFRCRTNCTILTTSRPWRLDVAMLTPVETDHMLVLNGLQGYLLDRLIDSVIKQMNNMYKKNVKAKHFKLKLQAKKINVLSQVPVIVMQLLTLWFDGEQIGNSQCIIYSNMVAFLLKLYDKKNGIDIETQHTPSRNYANIRSERQIPVCFKDNIPCTTHVEFLFNLGRLAFNTLLCDNRESTLVFDLSVVKKYISKSNLDMSLDIGILTQEKANDKISKRQSNVWFLHKTFQEFLAALYVALTLDTGELTVIKKKIMSVCCSVEYVLEMSQMFMFMSGLCPDVLSDLCEPLRQIVSEDNLTKKYRTVCELSGWLSTEGKILGQLQAAMMESLKESHLNNHTNICLPLSDVFIYAWSDDLQSLVVNNPVSSLFLWHVPRSEIAIGILNVTVFNTIQKLWLRRVEEAVVKHFISQLECSSNPKSETWKHLECVTFERIVDISSDIVCSLLDYLIQLPKSVKVRLQNVHIRKVSKDWRKYIRLHPMLTIDGDEGHHYDNDQDVDTIQFHTKKALCKIDSQ